MAGTYLLDCLAFSKNIICVNTYTIEFMNNKNGWISVNKNWTECEEKQKVTDREDNCLKLTKHMFYVN